MVHVAIYDLHSFGAVRAIDLHVDVLSSPFCIHLPTDSAHFGVAIGIGLRWEGIGVVLTVVFYGEMMSLRCDRELIRVWCLEGNAFNFYLLPCLELFRRSHITWIHRARWEESLPLFEADHISLPLRLVWVWH